MPNVLHLIKSPVPAHALATIRRQSREADSTLTVVLLHSATAPSLPAGVRVRRLGEEAAPHTPEAVTYSDLLDLIFTADQIIAW